MNACFPGCRYLLVRFCSLYQSDHRRAIHDSYYATHRNNINCIIHTLLISFYYQYIADFNMDFRHFRYFVTLAEELHFARAAERLGIAQPALSQQIKAMEEQLDARLFSRAKRRVELTEAGAAFLVEARAALACAEKAIRVAQDTARGDSGTIKIGFVGSVMYQPSFPRLLKKYRTDHPGVELQLYEMPILPQIEFVEEQQLDIAVVRAPLPPVLPDGVETFVLASQKLVAVLPHDHPLAGAKSLSLSQLAKDPFLAFNDPEGIGLGHALISLCREAGFEPDIQLYLSEVATLISLVAAGHGVSLITDTVAYLKLPDVQYVPLAGTEPYSELIVIHRRFERSAAVRELLARIRASTQEGVRFC